MLPKALHVEHIKEVSNDFHARYNAKKRGYRYIIKEGVSNPFNDDYVTFLDTVDFAKLQKNGIKIPLKTPNNVHLLEHLYSLVSLSIQSENKVNKLQKELKKPLVMKILLLV